MGWENPREFDETLAWEEWWNESRKVAKRACPACFGPIEDPDGICCEDCLTEFDDDYDR
jgi:predicted amidophosphoribosyltransferase